MMIVTLTCLLATAAVTALPLGSGSLNVSVDQVSYRTGDTIVVSITPNTALPDNETAVNIVVRQCNAILPTTCSEEKYLEWHPQPFLPSISPVRVEKKMKKKKANVSSIAHTFTVDDGNSY